MVRESRIVDQSGRPIVVNELAEPQTSKLGSLWREYAGHPSRGLTPGKLARILQDAEGGNLVEQCDLFEDMEEKDGHIHAELGKRKRALLGLDWDILPPRNASRAEQALAEYAREVIGDMADLEDIVFDMADAIGVGYSNLEIEWTRVGRERLPEVSHRPPSWFTLAPDNRNELRLRNDTPEGEALRPFGWISHVHKAKSGYVTRAGLHRVLAWPFLFKNYSVRDLAEFLEIYGLPVRLGQYPPGASEAEKATLLRAVVGIGHNAAGIIPQGMVIDFKEAARGASDPYAAMIEWCERTQSKAILGGTLTSQADGASSTNALGNVHNEVRHDLLEADARQLGATLTRDLVYPVIALNRGGIDSLRRCPRFVFDTREPDDLKAYAETLPGLVDAGLAVPVSYVRDKLKIPEPRDDEPVLGRPLQITAAKGADACPRCGGIEALKGDPAATPDDQQALDQVLESLADNEVQAQAEALLRPLLDLIRKAGPEAALGRLAEIYPEMDDAALTDQLARLIFVAETWGRINGRED